VIHAPGGQAFSLEVPVLFSFAAFGSGGMESFRAGAAKTTEVRADPEREKIAAFSRQRTQISRSLPVHWRYNSP
jgi:hypothetical protein